MYINWKITDDISNVTLNEFNREYNGIYGFIKLKINKNELGELEVENLEGDYDITYYLGKLIETGIAMYKKKKIKIMLLNRNLAQLVITFNAEVEIKFTSLDENEIYWSSKISKSELIKEIEYNYHNIYEYICMLNPEILNSIIMKKITENYNIFNYLKLVDIDT